VVPDKFHVFSSSGLTLYESPGKKYIGEDVMKAFMDAGQNRRGIGQIVRLLNSKINR
jgi:hypothetical protein